MKIKLWFNGPVVGSDIHETVDVQEYFGLDPDGPEFEKLLEEEVQQWAMENIEFGWDACDE